MSGCPAESRNNGHDVVEKPSACINSCTVVDTMIEKLAPGVAGKARGQKLIVPKMGRSIWSRWHVPAYASVLESLDAEHLRYNQYTMFFLNKSHKG